MLEADTGRGGLHVGRVASGVNYCLVTGLGFRNAFVAVQRMEKPRVGRAVRAPLPNACLLRGFVQTAACVHSRRFALCELVSPRVPTNDLAQESPVGVRFPCVRVSKSCNLVTLNCIE